MLRILAVCVNGMGTSLMMKTILKDVVKKNDIKAEVDSCSLGECTAKLGNVDVIVASNLLNEKLKRTGKIVVGLKNLVDEKEIETKLLEELKK